MKSIQWSTSVVLPTGKLFNVQHTCLIVDLFTSLPKTTKFQLNKLKNLILEQKFNSYQHEMTLSRSVHVKSVPNGVYINGTNRHYNAHKCDVELRLRMFSPLRAFNNNFVKLEYSMSRHIRQSYARQWVRM